MTFSAEGATEMVSGRTSVANPDQPYTYSWRQISEAPSALSAFWIAYPGLVDSPWAINISPLRGFNRLRSFTFFCALSRVFWVNLPIRVNQLLALDSLARRRVHPRFVCLLFRVYSLPAAP
jgi:hypothetical protein